MELNRRDVMEFYRALVRPGLPRGGKFSYAAAINAKRLKAEVESITEALKPLPGWMEYSKARNALLAEMADKDEHGKPVIQSVAGQEVYRVVERRTEYDEREVQLKESFKEELALQEAHEQQLEDLIRGTVEIPIHKITAEDVPADIAPEQLVPLWPMLSDPAN